MAILHLQLDIDSDVLPELHAALSSVTKSLSRAERLRQLASTGLIWEHLRVHAVGSGVPTPAPLQPPAPALAQWPGNRTALPVSGTPQPAPLPEPAAALSVADEAITLDGVAPADAAMALDPDVQPEPATPRSRTAPPLVLPVLDDVVEQDAPPAAAAAERPVPAAEAPTRSRKAPGKAAAPVLDPAADASGGRLPTDGTATVSPRKASSRSRIARMQEKGLFKNGE